jgi:membrane protein YqaA with SNARE-associated domain
MQELQMEGFDSPAFSVLEKHIRSKHTILIAFAWGIAEATIFFIVPDVYLGLVALLYWRRGVLSAFAAVLGAIIGGSLIYWLAYNNPSGMRELLDSIPLISAEMIDNVGSQIDQEGIAAIFKAPLSGIPYKIYAYQAGVQGLNLISFLGITVPARLERLLPVTLFAGWIGFRFKPFIKKHTGSVLIGYVLFWLAVYTFYAIRFS